MRSSLCASLRIYLRKRKHCAHRFLVFACAALCVESARASLRERHIMVYRMCMAKSMLCVCACVCACACACVRTVSMLVSGIDTASRRLTGAGSSGGMSAAGGRGSAELIEERQAIRSVIWASSDIREARSRSGEEEGEGSS